jgi:hypothetical protein
VGLLLQSAVAEHVGAGVVGEGQPTRRTARHLTTGEHRRRRDKGEILYVKLDLASAWWYRE